MFRLRRRGDRGSLEADEQARQQGIAGLPRHPTEEDSEALRAHLVGVAAQAEDPEAAELAGILLLADPEERCRRFQEVAHRNPDSYALRLAAASLHRECGDMGGCFREVALALALAPEAPAAFIELGRALLSQGESDLARRILLNAWDRYPRRERPRDKRAFLLRLGLPGDLLDE
ncbi:MAG: hypothetical protein HY321_21365 [Armatimonadetes bacterium]|nr:hypothetical protein [Armatimonadota bacterium]